VTPQSWVVSWYDFPLISSSQAGTVLSRLRARDEQAPVTEVRSVISSQQECDNYFQVTSSILEVCANRKRRQAYISWALARTRAHISGEATNGFPVLVVYTLFPFHAHSICISKRWPSPLAYKNILGALSVSAPKYECPKTWLWTGQTMVLFLPFVTQRKLN